MDDNGERIPTYLDLDIKKTQDLVNTIEELVTFQNKLTELTAVKREQDLFEKALGMLENHFAVPFFQVLLREMGRESFNAAYTRGEDTYLLETGVIDPAVLEWVMDKQTVSTIAKKEPWVEDDRVDSLLVAPLPGKTSPVGIIVLGVEFEENRFSTFHHGLVNTLCRQVGFVLENIQLSDHLQNLGNMLDNILESVPHAVVATGPGDTILACNKNAEFMFGFKRIMALGERYQDVLPSRVADSMSSVILRALDGEKTVDHEMEHELPGGQPITLGITASLLYDKDFAPKGVVFLCRDMTLSREVQKLRELDQMKSEFVQMVSHELKTPLTTIVGGAEILKMDLDQLSPEHAEIVGIIDSGSQRLHALITDLLDLSRLESGDKISLEINRIDLKELISNSINVSRREGKHEIEVVYEDELPPLFLDKAKMKQVFDNVIGNAVKYTPEGKPITIKVSRTREDVLVSVKDQGLGIDPKHLPYIFDKFYRADSSARGIEGTGLGLPIAKHIIELHGGELTVESEPDKGSTFNIVIPTKTGAHRK